MKFKEKLFKLVLIVITTLYSLSPISTLAMTQEQRSVIDSGARYFNVAEDCPTGSGAGIFGTGSSAAVGETFVAWNSGLKPPYIMEQYVIEVLKYIADYKKAPRENVVTQEHTAALLAFALGEGGDIANKSTFNLFNTSALRNDPEAMPYALGGSDGRQAYANFDVGIKATGGTLLQKRYTRIIDALLVKESTANDVLYNYAHYSKFPDNGWWAQQNEIDGEEKYYQKELSLLKQINTNYSIAATIIGTPEKELSKGLKDTSRLTYSAGGSADTSGGSSGQGSGGSGSCQCPVNGSGPGGVIAGSNGQVTALTYFTGKGLSREQAAGLVGNFVIESGENLDPTIVSPSGTYHGIAQWGDSAIAGRRWQKLQAWATANSKDPLALDVQLEYVWFELTTNFKPTYEKLKSYTGSTAVKDSVVIVLNEYEGAPGQKEAERIIAAEKVLSSNPGVGATGASTSCAGGSTGGISSIDGFTFPLQTTKSALKTGADKAVWCINADKNCHHDYNAGDIHVAVGTNVVAAKEGTVVLARNSSGSCGSSVAILGSDSNVYYYTHMQNGSIKAKTGQNIAAGAVIGAVGDKACGTAPHLHIDVQPPPATNRPGCSGAACSKYTFIDIQPTLKKAFSGLPE